MAKPQSKKNINFESKITRSIFLNGLPTNFKLTNVQLIFFTFKELVNKYITILFDNPTYILQILLNDKKDFKVREYQKSIRRKDLNSAYEQMAFDLAFVTLSNRMNTILNQIKTEFKTKLTSKKEIFAYSLKYSNKEEIIQALIELRDENLKHIDDKLNKINGVNAKEKLINQRISKESHYNKIIGTAIGINDKEFMDDLSMVKYLYQDISYEYKMPYLNRISIPLDSRIMKIEKSKDIKAPYVITFSNIFVKNEQIVVPLYLSGHAKRIIYNNDMAKSVTARIRKGHIEICWSYDMNKEAPDTTKYKGVDMGERDILHTSDDEAIGSFDPVIKYYRDEVEPAFAQRANLINKRRNIKKYLGTHKNLPENVRRSSISKMDRLNHMIQMMEAPYRKKRRYYQELDKRIKDAVLGYISTIGKDTMTVIERLDIREQGTKGKGANFKLTMFARSKLQKKLTDTLNENGYNFKMIEPDYTSQICPICGNLSKKNRNGKGFHCTCCGYKADADYVGALNIKSRATDKEVLEICKKYNYNHKLMQTKIVELYKERNKEYKKQNQL